MNKKLDPGLRSKLRAKQATGPAAAASPKPRSRAKGETTSDQVGVIVGFTGNAEDLTAIGFVQRTLVRHPRKGYSIATGVIDFDRLEALAAIPHVTTVEGPRRMHRELNFSLKEIRATAVHTGPLSRKGKGVVVGIIDSGIDWRHGSFVDENGKSRILAIWDQMLRFRAGDTRGPNNVGVVYNQDQLTNALKGNATVRTKDVDASNKREGHGTHVAGIAAGNGKPPTCCHVSQTYVGVAPEAELIVVRYDYLNANAIGETNASSKRSTSSSAFWTASTNPRSSTSARATTWALMTAQVASSWQSMLTSKPATSCIILRSSSNQPAMKAACSGMCRVACRAMAIWRLSSRCRKDAGLMRTWISGTTAPARSTSP